MGNLTLLVDISKWQTNDAESPQHFFDPVIAKEKGIQAAYLRIGYGRTLDTAVENFAESFEDAGLPYGFYHYAMPAGTTYGTALQQAEWFAEIAMLYDYKLVPMLDLEQDGVGLSYTKVWLERVAELCGCVPGIYTSPGFWNGLKDSENAVWAVEYPLWIANYFSSLKWPVYDIPDIVANSTTLPVVPDPWKKKGKTWSIWQFCATGDGEFYGGNYAKHTDEVGLDLDVFNGTYAELLETLGVGNFDETDPEDPIVVDPDPVEKPKYVRVIARQSNGAAGWLFFRDRAELYPGACLAIGYGTELELVESEKIVGDINYWHVLADGRDGYVSAGSAYTEIV